jgi:hypothetical protein
MWPYLVVCQLNEPDRYVPALNRVLGDWGARQVLQQSWLIDSDLNANAIIELLRPIVREDDRLLVMELADDRAAINLGLGLIRR